MGPRTDEFKKVKAELEERLDEAHDELRQGLWQRRAKAIAIVIGALATAVTAVTAHFRPETVAENTAGAAAVEIRKLQEAVEAQDKALRQSRRTCRSEIDNVRAMMLTHLLAAQGGKADKAEVKRSIGDVIKQLGETEKDSKPAVDLEPPSQLERLSKGKGAKR